MVLPGSAVEVWPGNFLINLFPRQFDMLWLRTNLICKVKHAKRISQQGGCETYAGWGNLGCG